MENDVDVDPNLPSYQEMLSDDQAYAESYMKAYPDRVLQVIRKTTCWSCKHPIDRLFENCVGVYGHICPGCHETLENHPYYGCGKPGDMAKWFRP